MSRLGYECDGCGDEFRHVGPAAVVRDDRGRMERELCSSCFDDHDSGGTSDPEEIERAQENMDLGRYVTDGGVDQSGNAREYVCSECGVHYSEDVATLGQCPVCSNRNQIDRIKDWIRDFAAGTSGDRDE